MTSNIEEEVNYTSLIELFGTFFEKVTTQHPEKDSLNKQLSDFKRVLYTNKSNFQTIDTYLDDLSQKTQGSLRIDLKSYSDEQLSPSKHGTPSSHSHSTPSPLNSRPFNAEAVKSTLKAQKFDLVTISDFIKYRSLEQSNQKQTLLSKYTHIRELELDSSNFYRLIAIGSITLLIQDPNSQPRFSEIIEDVNSRCIMLKNSYYSYTHDEYAKVFCGFMDQLFRLKKAGESSSKVLELFHDMIRYDQLFNIALLCYLKGKLIKFVTEGLPAEIMSNYTLKDQLRPSEISEKILNNNPTVFEPLLHVLPFLLNVKIVTQITENGTLIERVYSKSSISTSAGHLLQNTHENNYVAIHLLVERVFTTSNFYLLVPSPSKSVYTSTQQQRAKVSTFADSKSQSQSQKNLLTVHNTVSDPLSYLSKDLAAAKAKTLAIETAIPHTVQYANNSAGIYYQPRRATESSNSVSSSPYKRDDSIGQTPHGNFSDMTKNPLSPTRAHTSNLPGASLNEKENTFGSVLTSPSKSPLQRKGPELKDRPLSVNTSENRSVMRSGATVSQPQTTDTTPIYRVNGVKTDHQNPHDFSTLLTRQTESSDSELRPDVTKNTQGDYESPYDTYIKTRIQPSYTSQPQTQERPVAHHAKTNSSYTYNIQPFSATPYDNYVSSYDQPSNPYAPKPYSTTTGSILNNYSTKVSSPISKGTAWQQHGNNDHAGGETSATAPNTNQLFRDRLKNIMTMAPRTNDTAPSNPFTQLSSKYPNQAVNRDPHNSQYSNRIATEASNYSGSYGQDPRSASSIESPSRRLGTGGSNSYKAYYTTSNNPSSATSHLPTYADKN